LLCKQMTIFGRVLLLMREQAYIIDLFNLMLLTIHRSSPTRETLDVTC